MRICLFFLLIVFTSCAQTKSEKEEALEFAEEVIKTYFDNDCQTNYEFWADSVDVLGSYAQMRFKDRFPTKIEWCKKFDSKKRFLSNYTFEQYLKDYDLRIYSKSEFTNLDLMKKNNEDSGIRVYLNERKEYFDEGDYYFSGGHLNNDGSDDKIYPQGNWEMIITKTSKGWKIKGTLP